jgi:hypothetical protein
VIIERNIDFISASSEWKNILNVVVSGRRATIFFLSSCFFAAGWVSHVALDIFYPALLESRSSAPAMLLGIAFFGTVLLGLALFVYGSGSYFVEAFGFERRLIKRGPARIVSCIANRADPRATGCGRYSVSTALGGQEMTQQVWVGACS